jgi:hypothetical protein
LRKRFAFVAGNDGLISSPPFVAKRINRLRRSSDKTDTKKPRPAGGFAGRYFELP